MADFLFRSLFEALSLIERRLTIVMFHRVLPAPDALLPGEPDIALFARRVRWLASTFEILSLRDAVAALGKSKLPARALVITFDDGYADNAENALPVLLDAGIRATFFVTTRFLNGGMMWNDRVIEAVRAWPGTTMDLEKFGLPSLPLSAPRHRAIDVLLSQLKYLEYERREELSNQLLNDSGSAVTRLMMTAEQVRTLHRAGMEIGSHTHSHPIMCQMPVAELSAEITTNKRILEDIVETPITSFAYPNGVLGHDYNAAHIPLLDEFGFSCAVTTMPGTAADLRCRFEIPRYSPWDNTRGRYLMRLAFNYFKTPPYAGALTV